MLDDGCRQPFSSKEFSNFYFFFVENFSFAGLAGAAEGADRWPRSRRRPWQSKLKKNCF